MSGKITPGEESRPEFLKICHESTAHSHRGGRMPCVIGYRLVFQDSEAMMRHTHSRSRADTQPRSPQEERTLHGNQPPATCQSPRETEGGREAPAAPPITPSALKVTWCQIPKVCLKSRFWSYFGEVTGGPGTTPAPPHTHPAAHRDTPCRLPQTG